MLRNFVIVILCIREEANFNFYFVNSSLIVYFVLFLILHNNRYVDTYNSSRDNVQTCCGLNKMLTTEIEILLDFNIFKWRKFLIRYENLFTAHRNKTSLMYKTVR